MNNWEKTGVWSDKPALSRARETDLFNTFRRIALTEMRVPLIEEIPEEVDRKIFQEFLEFRERINKIGDAYELSKSRSHSEDNRKPL